MRTGEVRFDICGRKSWGFKSIDVQPRGKDAVELRLPDGDTFLLERQPQARGGGESVFTYGELPEEGRGQHLVLRVPEGRAAAAELRIESGNQDLFNRWTGSARLGT